jgi:hypothetical protein
MLRREIDHRDPNDGWRKSDGDRRIMRLVCPRELETARFRRF